MAVVGPFWLFQGQSGLCGGARAPERIERSEEPRKSR
jgi:hypothetical protein